MTIFQKNLTNNRAKGSKKMPTYDEILASPSGKEWIEQMGAELAQIREELIADLGERDIKYIKNIMRWQKGLEVAGRTSLFLGFGINPLAWAAGSGMLGVAKILENMEIGHNLMHGQYNWTNDKKMHSDTYEWDNVIPSEHWQYTHNFEHHTFTNIVGKDNDVGYGVLRMSEDQKWKPKHRFQLLSTTVLMMLFQNMIAFHYMRTEEWAEGKLSQEEKAHLKQEFKKVAEKFSKQFLKDYMLFPLLAGPFFLFVLTGNITANLIRNIWSYAIIFCGHFPEEVEMFPESVLENETKAQWYIRQIKGSANITGGKLFHILSGNLSHQIEHHLYPDIPAHRYQEVAPRVKAICEKYGVHYNEGSFSQQLTTVYKRIWRLSKKPKLA